MSEIAKFDQINYIRELHGPTMLTALPKVKNRLDQQWDNA